MDVYSHIIEGMQSDAMALLDGVLPPSVSQNINANYARYVKNALQISFSRGGEIGRRNGLKILS